MSRHFQPSTYAETRVVLDLKLVGEEHFGKIGGGDAMIRIYCMKKLFSIKI